MFEVKDSGNFGPEFTPGKYTLVLRDIVEEEGTGYDSGEPETFRSWRFQVLKPKKFAGEEIRGSSSMAFGPNSKTREWVETILGRQLKDGDKVDLPDLQGIPVEAKVKAAVRKDGTEGNMGVRSLIALDDDEREEALKLLETEAEIEAMPF